MFLTGQPLGLSGESGLSGENGLLSKRDNEFPSKYTNLKHGFVGFFFFFSLLATATDIKMDFACRTGTSSWEATGVCYGWSSGSPGADTVYMVPPLQAEGNLNKKGEKDAIMFLKKSPKP